MSIEEMKRDEIRERAEQEQNSFIKSELLHRAGLMVKRTKHGGEECPRCGFTVCCGLRYCPNCGQRIFWGNEK